MTERTPAQRRTEAWRLIMLAQIELLSIGEQLSPETRNADAIIYSTLKSAQRQIEAVQKLP